MRGMLLLNTVGGHSGLLFMVSAESANDFDEPIEVLTVLNTLIFVFWVVPLCRLIIGHNITFWMNILPSSMPEGERNMFLRDFSICLQDHTPLKRKTSTSTSSLRLGPQILLRGMLHERCRRCLQFHKPIVNKIKKNIMQVYDKSGLKMVHFMTEYGYQIVA